jgi:hypothetical protein
VPVAAFLADVVAVVLFAAIGRHTHAETDALTGVLTTAWPFLAGLAGGWSVALGWRRRIPWSITDALPVWLLTVGLGMVLRHLSGRGTPLPFVVVAALFLAAFLFGWRAAYRQWVPRRGRTS